jgi:Biotin-requiring enzyme.
VVISAMKMEIILSSPDEAVVEKIFKKEGEIVNKDELVIKLSFLEKG